MRMLLICIALFLVYSTCQAEIKMIFEPKEGVCFSYNEKGKQFRNETTKYSYKYEIQIDTSKQFCRIAAIEKDDSDSSPVIFFNCSILKDSPNMIVLIKNPRDPDPYQEFYFIYPKLEIGFMVIGKANDGFSSPLLPNFSPASISMVPLRLIDIVP